MKNKFIIALIVFFIWGAITVIGPKLQFGSEKMELDELVTRTIALNLVAAAVFLLVVTAYFGWWRGVGLKSPDQPKSWLLIWFPALIILCIAGFALLLGLPPATVVFFVLVNTLIVGLSEELMMRGIFLYGALSRFGIWSSVLLTSFVFGAIHALNGFLTGDFGAATVQAVAAGMSGILFAALRLRTNSLYPPILIHWLWDFSLFVLLQSVRINAADQPAAEVSAGQKILMPIFVALPTMLYGLWLLRGIGQRDKNEFIEDRPPA